MRANLLKAVIYADNRSCCSNSRQQTLAEADMSTKIVHYNSSINVYACART